MKTIIRYLFLSFLIGNMFGIGSYALAQKTAPLSEQEKTAIGTDTSGAPAPTSTTVKKLPAATGVKKKPAAAATSAVTSKPPTTVKKTSTLPVTPSYKPPTAATSKQSTAIKKTSTLPLTPSYKPSTATSIPSISGKTVGQKGAMPEPMPTPSMPGGSGKFVGQSGSATVAPRSGSAPLFPVSAGTGVGGQGQGIKTPSGAYVTPIYTPPTPQVKSTYTPTGMGQKGAMPEPMPTPSGPLGSGTPIGQPGSVTAAPRSGSVPLFPVSAGTGAGGQDKGVKTPASFLTPPSAGDKETKTGSEAETSLSGSTPPPAVDNIERLRLLREKYGKDGEGGAPTSDQAKSAETKTTSAPGSSTTSKETPPRSQAEIKTSIIPASPSTSIAPQRADDTSRIAGDGRIIQENPLVRELSGKDLMAMGNKLEEFINSYGGLKGGLLGGAGIAPPGSTGQSRIPGLNDLTGSQSGRSPQSVKDSLGTGLTSGQTGNIPSAPGGLDVPSGTGPVGDTGWQSPMESFGGSSGSSQGSGGGYGSDANKRGWISSESYTVNLGFGTFTARKDDNGVTTSTYTSSNAGKDESSGTKNTQTSHTTTTPNPDGSTTITHNYSKDGNSATRDVRFDSNGKFVNGKETVTYPTGESEDFVYENGQWVSKGRHVLPSLVAPGGKTQRVDPEHQPPPRWVIEAASKLLADIRSGNFQPTADENVIYRHPDAEGGKRYQGSTQLVKPPRPDQPVPGETDTGLTGNEPTPDEIRDPYGTRFGQDIDPTPPTSNDQGAK